MSCGIFPDEHVLREAQTVKQSIRSYSTGWDYLKLLSALLVSSCQCLEIIKACSCLGKGDGLEELLGSSTLNFPATENSDCLWSSVKEDQNRNCGRKHFSLTFWTGTWVFTDENVEGSNQKQAWDLLGPAVGRSSYSGIHDLEVF